MHDSWNKCWGFDVNIFKIAFLQIFQTCKSNCFHFWIKKRSWRLNSYKCAILYAKHFCKHMCENYNLGSVTWIPSKMITVERQRWDPLVIVVTCWSLLVHLKTFKWKYGGSWNYILIHFNLILTIYNRLGLGRDENMKSS